MLDSSETTITDTGMLALDGSRLLDAPLIGRRWLMPESIARALYQKMQAGDRCIVQHDGGMVHGIKLNGMDLFDD